MSTSTSEPRDPDEVLQDAVNKAFEEPDYVDTGDLINALDLALDRLNDFGVVITRSTYDD